MPDPTLPGTALRYAARDMTPAEVESFEARLAEDQDARDAVAEAVRLSAAAIGQPAPAPNPALRGVLRARPRLRAASGHPFAWVVLGAASAAVCTFIGLMLAEHGAPDAPPPAAPRATRAPVDDAPAPPAPERYLVTTAPMPHEAAAPVVTEVPTSGSDDERSVAEIWADLSTPDHVERAHDDERRLRQHVHDLSHPPHALPTKPPETTDGP